MEIYTIQMAQWRKAKEMGVELIDTTVKSGIKAFAPTWDMVTRVKQRTVENSAEEEALYTKEYTDLMRASYRANTNQWFELLTKDKIAIACYCKAGDFCHRHLLVKFILALAADAGVPAELKGEIT